MYVPILSNILKNPQKYLLDESVSCNCSECQDTCPCILRYGKAYQSGVVFQEKVNSPIIECNSNCACQVCPHRVTQQTPSALRVAKCGLKGLGVLAAQSIPKGKFVTEYCGEVVSPDTEGDYVFQTKEKTPSRTFITTINAEYYGNVARFVNHSCDPNCEVVLVRVDSVLPKICLFAKRDIVAEEEITFCYRENVNYKRCLCNSANCKGFF